MKGQNKKATTPAEYIAALEEPRRADIAALDRLVRKTAPELKRVIMNGVLGYGPLHYRYPSGREGDATRIGLASNARYISLYALGVDSRGYVAERYRARLPKAKIGRVCVTFKRLADLDTDALRDLIAETAKMTYGDSEQAPTPTRAGKARKTRTRA